VVLADFGAGLTAWLPCFGTGQVWVVDVDAMRLEAVIDAGRGPNAIAVDVPRARAYVANYAEDTITVIDADPQSPTHYGPIFRLGKRRLPE
jgi:DNA-binding beta-propeller fold protein YncE